MKRLKVTEEWVASQEACSASVRRFFKRWPNGLTVNRRNLYMAARELPIDDIVWMAHRLLHPKGSANEGYATCIDISTLAETKHGDQVTSPEAKHAYAKALADAAGL